MSADVCEDSVCDCDKSLLWPACLQTVWSGSCRCGELQKLQELQELQKLQKLQELQELQRLQELQVLQLPAALVVEHECDGHGQRGGDFMVGFGR